TEENPTQVVVSAVGAPDGQKACCSIETYGANPTAYWDGSFSHCCKGTPYRLGTDAEGNATYECCSGATEENPTQRVVSPIGAPDGIQTCCSIVDGQEPSAYWDGSGAVCCTGANNSAVKVTGDCYESDPDKYTCCATGVTAAVAGQSWSSCYGYCCDEGEVGALVGGSGVCCQPGEKGYNDGAYRCCPEGWNLETDHWPAACCEPSLVPCLGVCCEKEKCTKKRVEWKYCSDWEIIEETDGSLSEECLETDIEVEWQGGCDME
ncbi:MAG: hypothetical protein IJC30_01870, partial [Alphaproteobacteria bacterium]|nr:hypothetical protein [Alphaproteobacteria bacterium]